MTPTIHDRPVWVEPAYPVVGPRLTNHRNVTTNVIHYVAASNTPDGDAGETQLNVRDYLRGLQRHYTKSRGYALGYNFAVDWLGGIWVIRGWDIANAANSGHNATTISTLLITDGETEPSALAISSARWLADEVKRRSGRSMMLVPHGAPNAVERPWGHGELHKLTGRGTSTGCPGAGVYKLLHGGAFDYNIERAPTFAVDPTKPDLKLKSKGEHVRFLQWVLKTRAGQDIVVDGSFGKQTKAAVINVQTFTGLDATGIVDAATWAVIDMLAGLNVKQ